MSAQIIPFPQRADRDTSGRMNEGVTAAAVRLLDELFASHSAGRPVTPEWVAHMEAVLAGDE
jgi:hypothetical protein